MPMHRYKVVVTFDLYFLKDAAPTMQYLRDSFAGDLEARFYPGGGGFESGGMTVSEPEEVPYDPPPEDPPSE